MVSPPPPPGLASGKIWNKHFYVFQAIVADPDIDRKFAHLEPPVLLLARGRGFFFILEDSVSHGILEKAEKLIEILLKEHFLLKALNILIVDFLPVEAECDAPEVAIGTEMEGPSVIVGVDKMVYQGMVIE